MSLQGSIETFAIADVLRLLAATSKSGRLHVQGPSRSGTIWVDNARVLAAESPTTPHVGGPTDVLFQMLRFERGSFRFEIDKYPPDPGEPLDIELALGEAESMLQEWRELEARIPGTDSWVSLAGSLRDGNVVLGPDEWRTVVAVGGGRSIAEMGDALEASELATNRMVSRLLDLGLAEVGTRPTNAPAATPTVSAPSTPAPAPAPEAPAAPSSPVGGLAAGAAAAAAPVIPASPPVLETPEADNRWHPEPATAAPDANGASLAPPAEPTPWAPAEPSPAPTWSSPSEFVGFAPPPAAAPPAPAFGNDTVRPEAGLTNPLLAPSDPPAVEGAHAFPANTYDFGAAPADTEYVYPDEAEPLPAPPAAETAPPAWEFPTPATPTVEPPAPAYGYADPGYPPLPPPLPPIYGQPGTAAAPPPPPPPPVWPTDNGTITPPPPPPAPAAEADAGWVGSLSSAIEQADAPPEAETGPGLDVPAPPPPPGPVPLPPLPSQSWAGPNSLFEGGTPERLAPPPPPPPPPPPFMGSSNPLGESGENGEGARADAGTLTALQLAENPGELTPETATEGVPEDADDIERQLFNLSPRAREAVKQSSGLYENRGRR